MVTAKTRFQDQLKALACWLCYTEITAIGAVNKTCKMKMVSQHFWKAAAKAAAIGLLLAIAPLANAFTITQITDNAIDDWHPKISGNNIVWYANDGNDDEIYWWDGSATTQFTNNATDDKFPAISGSNVAWMRDDGDDFEIYLWDGSARCRLPTTRKSTISVEYQVAKLLGTQTFI